MSLQVRRHVPKYITRSDIDDCLGLKTKLLSASAAGSSSGSTDHSLEAGVERGVGGYTWALKVRKMTAFRAVV